MDNLPVKNDTGLKKTYHEAYWKFGKHDRNLMQAGIVKPIGWMEGKDLEDGIKALLQFIKKDIGLKQELDSYTFSRFLTYVRDYYSDLTLKEVKLAFEYALVGLLDEYLPKRFDGTVDIKHYQDFSADYYTKILNAYKNKKNKVWQKAMKIESDKFLYEKKEMSEEERKKYNKAHIDGVIEMFDGYCQTGRIKTMFPFLIINDFIEWELLKERRTFTDEHYELAKDQYVNTGSVSRYLARTGYKGGKIGREAQHICDLETISVVFEQILNDGKDIRDYAK